MKKIRINKLLELGKISCHFLQPGGSMGPRLSNHSSYKKLKAQLWNLQNFRIFFTDVRLNLKTVKFCMIKLVTGNQLCTGWKILIKHRVNLHQKYFTRTAPKGSHACLLCILNGYVSRSHLKYVAHFMQWNFIVYKLSKTHIKFFSKILRIPNMRLIFSNFSGCDFSLNKSCNTFEIHATTWWQKLAADLSELVEEPLLYQSSGWFYKGCYHTITILWVINKVLK
jgi:hypothetical protein